MNHVGCNCWRPLLPSPPLLLLQRFRIWFRFSWWRSHVPALGTVEPVRLILAWGGAGFLSLSFCFIGWLFCFFSPRLVCATQKQPLRKEGKKRKEKKKEERLVFLAGCELFPPHYFPKNRSEHESFNNKYVAVFVCFGTKKTFFWSSPKVFFHVWILRKAAILHAFAPLDPDASDSFHLQHQNMCILIFFNSAATKINLFFINTRAVCLLNVRKVQDELDRKSVV